MDHQTQPFQYVLQGNDGFLQLWPHRYDYIWAEHPQPGEKPNWQTEGRYPLSDRLIQQGAYLYGVRFGSETDYCLLDIDRGSAYHPRQDPFAISRLVAALEPLGLVTYIACTSSYTGGLHLYFPFQVPQSSWQLAIAVTALIQNAGFKLKPGQLEVFPDPKPYNITSRFSLFNAHRLPLQVGSYLLDHDFQPIWGDHQTFVQRWQWAQQRNEVEASTIRQQVKQMRRRRYTVSTKVDQFINDLNAEIELGWTDFGQTNRLLGRITMREYIFHHLLIGGPPLTGTALVEVVVNVARSLPGYTEYCRHQHEIEHRVTEWVHCIENSHYFHYGDASGRFKAKLKDSQVENTTLTTAIDQVPTWNQQQSESARDRIRRAIADLLEKNALPALATPRYRALLKYGIGGQTLYCHRDLWHPTHLVDNIPASFKIQEVECLTATSTSPDPSSLFLMAGSDSFPGLDSSDVVTLPAIGAGSDSSSALPEQPVPEQPVVEAGDGRIHAIRQRLADIRRQQMEQSHGARKVQQQLQQAKWDAAQAKHEARMVQYLESGDPILMAEALTWARQRGSGLVGQATERGQKK